MMLRSNSAKRVLEIDEQNITGRRLRWLKTVSRILMGRYNYSLSLDTIMVSIMVTKNYLVVGEHIAIIS